jgi:hypothetical protein
MNAISEAVRLVELYAPRRNNYFYGKLMDVPHFEMEQNYLVRQRWLLNRLTLGQGVLCGLSVTPSADRKQICVSPGVAIDALGREIVVPLNTCVDPWQLTAACGETPTPLPKQQAHQVYLCLCYRECTSDFTPVLVTDCNTREQCSPGTIVESFCLLVQQTVPPPPPPPTEPPVLADPNPQACAALRNGVSALDRRKLLSQALSSACAAPTADLCVPLATVNLTAIDQIDSIDSFTPRPRVYSNAVLLDLILCLAARIEQLSCSNAFPAGYIPFDQISSTAGPDPATGDSVVVGRMSLANFKALSTLPLPGPANQVYCGPVTLVDGSTFIAYVPTPAERMGDFSQFAMPLTDPNSGNPFPNNTIPATELPGTANGVFAWRIRSKVS